MATKKVGRIKIFYSNKEQKTADLVEDACERALERARDDWGVTAPDDCRVYVMTSWQGFIFKSTPLKWKITLYLTLPLWVPRIRRTWPYSAAWTQRFGHRIAIGIKPPRLVEKSDRKIGEIMNVEEPDEEKYIKNIACHELIHACSANLILPMWLNEGIAIVSTDRFAGRPVIKEETLSLVKGREQKRRPPSYAQVSKMEDKAIAYHDSRGYWIVRYLEDKHPGFLKDLLLKHRYEDEIEEKLADVLGIDPKDLWLKIDDIVTDHFMK